MMILKYAVAVTDRQTIYLPTGARILSVQWQNDALRLWALCDASTETTEPRRIAIYGTGHPIQDDPGVWLATFQTPGGAMVFHVFECGVP